MMGNYCWQALGGGLGAGSRTATVVVVVAFAAVLIAAAGCRAEEEPVVVVAAAGDIAACNSKGDEETARLVEGIDGATVLALGDLAYPDGAAEDFAECYDPSWGQFKERTKPTPGNHDYYTQGASGYFDYFGKAAGEPDEGYYSYDRGSWHMVSLNSNCAEKGVRCGAGSAQREWLEEDLAAANAADDGQCTLAYMHHPRFSSGEKRGSHASLEPLWEALYEGGADVVLSAHEHNYERFAPQDPYGKADPQRGIRQFVVGTGGKSHYPIVDPLATSEVQNDKTYGVLKLTLRPRSYEWRFVPVEGAQGFTDSGSTRCH
jgi:calcineurin-like phosphoesterase family protein